MRDWSGHIAPFASTRLCIAGRQRSPDWCLVSIAGETAVASPIASPHPGGDLVPPVFRRGPRAGDHPVPEGIPVPEGRRRAVHLRHRPAEVLQVHPAEVSGGRLHGGGHRSGRRLVQGVPEEAGFHVGQDRLSRRRVGGDGGERDAAIVLLEEQRHGELFRGVAVVDRAARKPLEPAFAQLVDCRDSLAFFAQQVRTVSSEEMKKAAAAR